MPRRWPDVSEKILLSSERLYPSGILCMWKTTAFIFCPSIITVYFSPALHSSIRPFISPSINSYRLCSTCGSICHDLCDACAFLYRHLNPNVHLFQIAWNTQFHCRCFVKKMPGYRKAFEWFFSWETIILSISITQMLRKACNSCRSFHDLCSVLWPSESLHEWGLRTRRHFIAFRLSLVLFHLHLLRVNREAGSCWRGEESWCCGSQSPFPSLQPVLLSPTTLEPLFLSLNF